MDAFFKKSCKDEESNKNLVAIFPALEAFMKENQNGGFYLNGTSDPSYLDIHCFVILERLCLAEFKENEIK